MSSPTCPACDEPLRYQSTKLGGFSVSCGMCGFQGFAKSPKAASAIRAKVEPTAPAPTVPGKPAPTTKRDPNAEVFGD